jgi:acyl-CoA thioesterase-1
VNLGVNGDTSTRVLARLGQLDTYHPKVVIVLVGGNDALRAVPHDTTFSNIALIIQNIQKRGAIVLLLGVRGGLPFDDPYAAPFQQLSETYHTAFVPDVLAGVFEDNTKMSDVIHPNDAGYAYIASRVYPVLKPLVQ